MNPAESDRHEHRLAVDSDWRADLRYGAMGEEEPLPSDFEAWEL